MADPLHLQALDAFSPALLRGPGVRVSARPRPGIAAVTARAGQDAAVAARVREVYGLTPPAGPERAIEGEIAFLGVGPGAWLAVRETLQPNWAADLAAALDGLAAVADQTGAYGVLRVEGPGARDLLARGVFIDLHPAAFSPGRAAVTQLLHFGCVLWRPGGTDGFDVAVFRSVAEDVWRWFKAAVAALPAPELLRG